MKHNISHTKQIDLYLYSLEKRRIPLIRGSFTEIAKEFGVSRELVRVRAKILGVKFVSKYPTKTCPLCQKNFISAKGSKTFCSRECRKGDTYYRLNRLLTCDICGRGIILRTVDIARSRTKKFYCSHKCYGKSETIKQHGQRLREIYGKDYYYKISRLGNRRWLNGP